MTADWTDIGYFDELGHHFGDYSIISKTLYYLSNCINRKWNFCNFNNEEETSENENNILFLLNKISHNK